MKYKYVGDYPISIPSHGLEAVEPGAVIEVTEEINHPLFDLVKKSTSSKEA